MLKNVINSYLKASSNRRFENSPSQKRTRILESTLSDHRSSGFNPKRARYKSVKGLSILNKEL